MILPIDHKHRIRSDEHCWAVETTRKRGSKTCWRGISYHPTLEAAVNSLGQRMVRTSNATTLVEALRAVEDSLYHALPSPDAEFRGETPMIGKLRDKDFRDLCPAR